MGQGLGRVGVVGRRRYAGSGDGRRRARDVPEGARGVGEQGIRMMVMVEPSVAMTEMSWEVKRTEEMASKMPNDEDGLGGQAYKEGGEQDDEGWTGGSSEQRGRCLGKSANGSLQRHLKGSTRSLHHLKGSNGRRRRRGRRRRGRRRGRRRRRNATKST